MPRDLKPCGTVAAFERHRRRGEEPCEDCREAKRRAGRDYYIPRAQELQPCGTPAAYGRHLVHGEEACRACKDAKNAAVKASKAKAPEARRQRRRAECGTASGYVRHKRKGETPCEPCRAAKASAQSVYRTAHPLVRKDDSFYRMLAEAWAETAVDAERDT